MQGAPCRIDVELRDARGHRYRKSAVVKNSKNGEAEELPLFTNHDTIQGEVRGCCWHPSTAHPNCLPVDVTV